MSSTRSFEAQRSAKEIFSRRQSYEWTSSPYNKKGKFTPQFELIGLNFDQLYPKGRSILFNHFIDMRTTVNLSISCRKNVFLLKFSNKNTFFLHEMDKLMVVLMSIKWLNKIERPLSYEPENYRNFWTNFINSGFSGVGLCHGLHFWLKMVNASIFVKVR